MNACTPSRPQGLLLRFISFCMLLVSVFFCMIPWSRTLNEPLRSSAVEEPSSLPVVILDPGHGGEDGGAVGVNGTEEKALNLLIATEVRDGLRAAGIEVVMTREDDRLLYDPTSDYKGKKKIQDLTFRRRIAEQYGNAIFISIHMNAFPQAQYKGLQVYYSENDPKSAILAEKLRETCISTLQPTNNRKSKPGEGIYLLEQLHCPAVLIECGFLSNPEECTLLGDPDYRQKLSLVLSLSILDFLYENGT